MIACLGSVSFWLGLGLILVAAGEATFRVLLRCLDEPAWNDANETDLRNLLHRCLEHDGGNSFLTAEMPLVGDDVAAVHGRSSAIVHQRVRRCLPLR